MFFVFVCEELPVYKSAIQSFYCLLIAFFTDNLFEESKEVVSALVVKVCAWQINVSFKTSRTQFAASVALAVFSQVAHQLMPSQRACIWPVSVA